MKPLKKRMSRFRLLAADRIEKLGVTGILIPGAKVERPE
jgi:hypothetical protein